MLYDSDFSTGFARLRILGRQGSIRRRPGYRVLLEPVVLNIAIRQVLVVCATSGSHTDLHISVLR